MSSGNLPVSAAQERIRNAYDPEMFRTAAHRYADLLATHLHEVQSSQKAVLNWNAPIPNCDLARRSLDEFAPPGDRAKLAERFGQIVESMLARGHNLHDPRYVGHQVPASIPLAGLFDAVGSVTNQVMAIYEM